LTADSIFDGFPAFCSVENTVVIRFPSSAFESQSRLLLQFQSIRTLFVYECRWEERVPNVAYLHVEVKRPCDIESVTRNVETVDRKMAEVKERKTETTLNYLTIQSWRFKLFRNFLGFRKCKTRFNI